MPAPSSRAPSLTKALLLIVVMGAIISCVAFGVRSVYGFFTLPLSNYHQWDREIFAFAVALQNLFWGLGQPLAGVVVDKFGPARVIAIGGIIYALGVALMSYVTTPLGLHLTSGVMVGLGLSCCSFNTVLAAFSRIMPVDKRSWAIGVCTAAGSSGQFFFAPLGQAFISQYGWMTAALLLGSIMLTVPIMAGAFAGHGKAKPSQPNTEERTLTLTHALKYAFAHKAYILLIIGFFVCGFQLAFITYHFPPYLQDAGISKNVAGWAIGLIGLANVVGAYSSGICAGKFNKAYLLSIIYGMRGLCTLIFLLVPLSVFSIYVYAVAMGLLWLSTVPPTSGLVLSMFGTRYMATLYGFVFLNHQLGSFVGAWMGGYLYDKTGNYDVVWWGAVILSFLAALLHFPIKETRSVHFAN